MSGVYVLYVQYVCMLMYVSVLELPELTLDITIAQYEECKFFKMNSALHKFLLCQSL